MLSLQQTLSNCGIKNVNFSVQQGIKTVFSDGIKKRELYKDQFIQNLDHFNMQDTRTWIQVRIEE